MSFLRRFGPISVAYAVIAFLTRAYYVSDTLTYANDILAFSRGYSDIPVNPFWEFGHLFWRPLGFVCYKLLSAVLPASLGLDDRLVCAIGLMGFSLICGWLAVTLFYALALQFTGSRALSYVIALSLMCTNSFLNHMHAGHAYVPGVAFLTLGIWLIVHRGSVTLAWASGAALACSVLLWFPFVLVVPAALLAGLLGTGAPARGRIRFVTLATIACVCCGALGYMIGAVESNALSVPALKAWFIASRHGILPDRNLPRTLFGLPRTFVFVSDDGVLFKRFLFHDPYAHVSVLNLLRVSLVKVGLFYLAVLALLVSLGQGPFARRMLVCFLAALVPMLAFAVFLFQGGDLERFLPLFPFICLALAAFFTAPRRPVWATAVAVMFILVVFVSNLQAEFYRTVAAYAESMATRVRVLKPVFKPHSRVALITYQDSLMAFGQNFPFHPLNRPVPLNMFPIVERAHVSSNGWAPEFATQALRVWDQSGDLWVTKRVWAPRPAPNWDWVEGDWPNLSWNQLDGFFCNLEVTSDIGGPDGFFRVPPSDHNRQFLLSWAARAPQPSLAADIQNR